MGRCSLLVCLALAFAGCTAFEGYYYSAKHFPYGTRCEREFGKSLERTLANLKLVLRENGMSIVNVEQKESSAQVTATKDGRKYIFDVTEEGEGCKVHMEIDQAGNDAIVFSLMRELELLP